MAIFSTLLQSCNYMAPSLLCWIDVLSFNFVFFVWFPRKATSFVFYHVVNTASISSFLLHQGFSQTSWECKLVVCGKYLCGSIAYFLSDLEIHQSSGFPVRMDRGLGCMTIAYA